MQLFYDSATPVFYDAPTSHYDSGAAEPILRKMKKIKADSRNLPVPNKVLKGQEVAGKLAANAALPQMAAFSATLLTATTLMDNDYKAAVAAADTAKQLFNAARVSESAWDTLYVQGAADVNKFGTTEAVRLSSGYPLESDRTPIGPLPAPANFTVTFGDMPGTLSFTMDPVKGAKTYLIELATAATGPFTQVLVSTSSDGVVPGLTSGTVYYLRAKAVGAAGTGAASDIAMKMAP
ncbi:MAG: hypothetical protein HY301_15730 [Verrucomicrobia bacterium]|nr:hypothetical protein [Verrucomicrobiota bacterium]